MNQLFTLTIKKKKYFLFLIMIFFCNHLFAQRTISGTVFSSKTGETLIGVTVAVKDGKNAAITNNQGKFIINIPGANGTLIFTYVGFNTKEVALTNQTTLNVK